MIKKKNHFKKQKASKYEIIIKFYVNQNPIKYMIKYLFIIAFWNHYSQLILGYINYCISYFCVTLILQYCY